MVWVRVPALPLLAGLPWASASSPVTEGNNGCCSHRVIVGVKQAGLGKGHGRDYSWFPAMFSMSLLQVGASPELQHIIAGCRTVSDKGS